MAKFFTLPGDFGTFTLENVRPPGAPKKASPIGETFLFVLALPIFPASHPASIVGADELNFCVRDGNRWTLVAIKTNFVTHIP